MNSIAHLLPDFLEHLEKERQLEPETLRNYRSDLLQLDAFLAGKAVQSIELDDLRAWMRHLKDIGRARATIRRKMHTCSSFWRFLHLIDLVDDVMPQKVLLLLPKYRRHVPDMFLSIDELVKFSQTPSPLLRDTLAWKLLAWLGLRRGEIINLKIKHVRIDEREIFITGKGKRKRIMPLNDELILLIKAISHGREKEDYLLAGEWGGKWSKNSFSHRFNVHLKRCGLDDKYTPHTLRHTFATHLIMAGTPIALVSRLMGHKDITTTWAYVHHTPEHLKEGMQLHPLVTLVKQ